MGGGCGSRSPGFLEGLLEYGTGTSKILGESEGGGSDVGMEIITLYNHYIMVFQL
jgi:hypothetical protein